ncbi:hypothetical protein ACR30L_18540 [Psychromonas sp. PT13]|uniref:hypothetical protein n=1 Tax=Psychromonas sp. PT13 TaxID=3439547 RepID=UPI003EBCDADE
MENKTKTYVILVTYNALYAVVINLLAQTNFMVVCNNSDLEIILSLSDRSKIFNFADNLGVG